MKGKIFNAQEVQAIIAGNKTMFREVIKPKINLENYSLPDECGMELLLSECPYKVGQKIFVKERFLQKLGSTQLPSGEHETFFTGSNVEYVADGAQERWVNPDAYYSDYWKKRPAQHMKQEQSRITLEIISIKVERLADISEGDAIAEGLPLSKEFKDRYYTPENNYAVAKIAFMRWWNATHKKPEEKFDANPFVWVVDFKVNK